MIVSADAKSCSTCKESKPYNEFGANKTRKDGYNNQCKSCYRAVYLVRTEGCKRYVKFGGTKKEYNEQYHKNHYSKNKGYYRNKCAIRERTLWKATPKWRNTFFIEEMYHLSQLRTALTGIRWEVDHIIPINSPFVCGLHVEHNLQVIPAVLNRRKGNSLCCEGRLGT